MEREGKILVLRHGKEGLICNPILYRYSETADESAGVSHFNFKVTEVQIKERDSDGEKIFLSFQSNIEEKLEDEGGKLLVMSPEYGYIPLMKRKFFVIWSDWNLNLPVFLQNLRKFKGVFVDGAGARRFKGKLPVPIFSFPVFSIYARCKDFISSRGNFKSLKSNFKTAEGEKDGNFDDGKTCNDVGEREIMNCSDINDVLKNKKIDVFFLGNMNPGIHSKRNQLLRKILLLPERYKVVVGLGIYDESLYCKLMSKSKIVFNRSVRKEMNMRVFEATRTLSLLFLEDENEETWDYFEKWKEVIPYNEDNLVELIEKYIQDDKEREKVVISAFEKVSQFSYDSMWAKIIEIMQEFERLEKSSGQDDSFSQHESFEMKLATFRSLINSLVNLTYDSSLLDIAEKKAFELLELAGDKRKKAEILNDLAFLFFFFLYKVKDNKDDFRKLKEKAIRYIDSALAFNPSSVIIWLNSAILNYSIGDRGGHLKSAGNCLNLISKKPIYEILGEVSGLPNPNSPFLFFHYDFFKRAVERALHRYFDYTEKLREEILKIIISSIYFSLGKEALDNRDFSEAEKFFFEVLRRIPDFPEAYFGLGLSKLGKGEYRESASVMLKGYELDPLNLQQWSNIIYSLSLSGNRSKLKEIFNEMKIISSRLYVMGGMDIKVGNRRLRVKSAGELFSEFGM